MCCHSTEFCYVILLGSFVLTLYKNSPFMNTKLFKKIYCVKTCFQRGFEFFKKNIYKEKCGTVKK